MDVTLTTAPAFGTAIDAPNMDVFKTSDFLDDDGIPTLIDTISHEGRWWLVGSWIQPHGTTRRIPETLVLLGSPATRFQEISGKSHRFLLSNAIPTAVLDGETRTGFVVLHFAGSHTDAHIRPPSSTH